jgi:hypothetical protein
MISRIQLRGSWKLAMTGSLAGEVRDGGDQGVAGGSVAGDRGRQWRAGGVGVPGG